MTQQRDPLMELRSWMVTQERRPDYLPEVFAVTARTRQRSRSLLEAWRPEAWLPQAPVVGRRTWTVAVIALLLAALVGGLLVVGRLLENNRLTPVTIRNQEKPLVLTDAEIGNLVRSAYARMPELPPLVLTAAVDGTSMRRISVGASGDVRVEDFASLDAPEPATYTIYAGVSIGELVRLDGAPYWYANGGISEDPRVFVYAAMQGAAFGDRLTIICPGGTDPADAFENSAWTAVSIEGMLGRIVYRLHCAGDLWIDRETSLVLRSEGPKVGLDGYPIPGAISTIVATKLEFRTPPADLFELAAPPGVAAATDDQHNLAVCRKSGRCLTAPREVAVPQPAPADPPPETADELVTLASGQAPPLPAYEVEVQNTNTGLALALAGRTRVLFDGAGRYRTEATSQPGTAWESTMVVLSGDGHSYMSEAQPDGSVLWRSSERGGGSYPLGVPGCDAGWQLVGVDLIASRVADHVSCRDKATSAEIWIDRELRVVLRSQMPDPFTSGVSVDQVSVLRLGASDPSLFELPPGVVPQPG